MHTQTCAHINTQLYTYACIDTYTQTHKCMNTYKYAYAPKQKLIRKRIHTIVYLRTYTRT